jgi:hypothetical protein
MRSEKKMGDFNCGNGCGCPWCSHGRGDGEIRSWINDDPLRADLIAKHFTTTVKSMKKIVELRKQNPVNYNQFFLWN